MWKGKPIANTSQNRNLADLDYLSPQCPPPDGKLPPLSDEEKRTFVRWIDLGCPIDLDYDPANPQARGYGWMLDDNRPTLTVMRRRRRTLTSRWNASSSACTTTTQAST